MYLVLINNVALYYYNLFYGKKVIPAEYFMSCFPRGKYILRAQSYYCCYIYI